MPAFEFVSIEWLKPLLKELGRIRGNRAEELRRISDVFGDPQELARYYIEPKCQHHNPADRHEDQEPIAQVRAPAFQVINDFLNGDVPLRGGRTQMFILSDAGMGKTSLLMMLRLSHLTAFWPKGYDCLLLKLGEDTLETVRQHENKAGTVLLLDALDEDPLAWDNIEGRLLDLLKATEQFRRVIISCRTQFFPETSADPFGNPGRVEVGGYICPMMFLSLFDEGQVEAYLRRRLAVRWYDPRTYANRDLRRQAEELVTSMQSLRFRPLLLAHVKDILRAEKREWNAYTLYQALVEAWLLREERKLRKQLENPPDKETLWAVCAALAWHMQKRGMRTLSQEQLDGLVQGVPEAAYLRDFNFGGRSLLNRNSKGAFRFSHYSIQEFLVVHALVTGQARSGEEKIRATDQIMEFLGQADGEVNSVLGRLDFRDHQNKGLPEFLFRDRLANGVEGPALRIIPPGGFLMGSTQGLKYARPLHRVSIPVAFALGACPVTFEEYDRFAEATGQDKPTDGKRGRGRRPVINISWKDAKNYCAWLSEQTGQNYRLPTEAEWEYASRAGTTSEYWWGDGGSSTADHAWFVGNSNRKTHPVGEKRPNPWGLQDTSGNVWEWTQDCWHFSYEGAPEDGSAWESESGDVRVVRGGSWLDKSRDLGSSVRAGANSVGRFGGLGFRLARSL